MYPVGVKRVGTVYKPDGRKIHKVIISEEDKKKLPTSLDKLERVLIDLLDGKNIELESR